MSKKAEAIKAALVNDTPRVQPIPDDAWLSSGCTLLNLAVSNGNPNGMVAKGHFLWIVGQSSSGKTWEACQILAEAANNDSFADHRLIFDNVENGMLFDVAGYFGRKLVDRIEPPHGTVDDPEYSVTVEDFYDTIWDLGKRGDSFVYVVDSMDALRDIAGDEKYEKQKEARDKGGDEAGTMGMSKAKVNSDNIKRVKTVLRDTGSILIGLSQERDNVKSPYGGKVTSGGKALRFYATVQLWCRIKGDLKRKILDKDREYGKLIEVSVEKNQVAGWEGKVSIPFLRGHGFDDAGASVDYLTDEGHWPKDKQGWIDAAEFKVRKRREDLIRLIEEDPDRAAKLANVAAWLWRKIDEETRVKRVRRYE